MPYDKNKEENLVRFLLTNLAIRRLGGFGFARLFCYLMFAVFV